MPKPSTRSKDLRLAHEAFMGGEGWYANRNILALPTTANIINLFYVLGL